MDLKSTYNRIADDWANDHAADVWWIEGTEKFCTFLKPGATILDVGCGGGFKTKWLSDKGFKVKGIDFSENMIKAARKKYPALDFDVFDIHDLGKMNKTFDAIFAQAVLLHVKKKDVPAVLGQMNERLNEGGLMYISVKERGDGKPEESIEKEHDYGYEYERFFSFFTMDEFQTYFAELGMEIVWSTVTFSGRTNWLQIVVRSL